MTPARSVRPRSGTYARRGACGEPRVCESQRSEGTLAARSRRRFGGASEARGARWSAVQINSAIGGRVATYLVARVVDNSLVNREELTISEV